MKAVVTETAFFVWKNKKSIYDFLLTLTDYDDRMDAWQKRQISEMKTGKRSENAFTGKEAGHCGK
jgi:hypothetical protein